MRILLCLFVSVLAFAACQKELTSEDPVTPPPGNNDTCLLGTLTQGAVPGDDSIFRFYYDNSNRLTAISQSDGFPGGRTDTLHLTYNSSGRLAYALYDNPWEEEYYFEYTNGKVTRLAQPHYFPGSSDTAYITFEYSGDKIVKSVMGNENGISEVRTYDYDATGNITTRTARSANGTLMETATFTYLSRKNTLSSLAFLMRPYWVMAMNPMGFEESAWNTNELNTATYRDGNGNVYLQKASSYVTDSTGKVTNINFGFTITGTPGIHESNYILSYKCK